MNRQKDPTGLHRRKFEKGGVVPVRLETGMRGMTNYLKKKYESLIFDVFESEQVVSNYIGKDGFMEVGVMEQAHPDCLWTRENILRPSFWENRRRVALTGQCGAGKSSYQMRLAFDWAHLNSDGAFDLVILLKLGEVRKKMLFSLEDILVSGVFLNDEAWRDTVQLFLRLFRENGKKVLWMIDGWDEIDVMNGSILEAIRKGSDSPVEYLLVCARPETRKRIVCDTVLSVKPLTNEQIMTVCHKVTLGFDGFAKHKWLEHACSVPLILRLFCILAAHSTGKDFTRVTSLFKGVTDHLLVLLSERQMESRFERFELQRQVRKELRVVAWASFFEGKEVKDCVLESKHSYYLLSCGIFKTDESDAAVGWIHCSFQEFLAAEFVCMEMDESGVGTRLREILFEKLERSNVFFGFVCGIGKHALDPKCLDKWFPSHEFVVCLEKRDHAGITRDAMDELSFFSIANGPIMWVDEDLTGTILEFVLRSRLDLVRLREGEILADAARSGSSNVVSFLLEKLRVSPDTLRRGTTETPLQIASWHGHLDVVKLLWERGADLDFVRGGDRWTALHMASYCGHDEVANFLIDKNANVNVMAPFKRLVQNPVSKLITSGEEVQVTPFIFSLMAGKEKLAGRLLAPEACRQQFDGLNYSDLALWFDVNASQCGMSNTICDVISGETPYDCFNKKRCSLEVTKNNFKWQYFRLCVTCWKDDKTKGACRHCINVHHTGHILDPPRLALSYCDVKLFNPGIQQ